MRNISLIIFIFLTFQNLVFAQKVVSINDSTEHYIFAFDDIDYREDLHNNLDIVAVSASENQSLFSTNNLFNPENFNKDNSYWYRIKIKQNKNSKNRWILEFYDQTIDHIEFYTPKKGYFDKKTLGDLQPFSERSIRHKNFIINLDNCDHPEYPIAVMDDLDAKKYIDGSAFHLYLGEITALSKVHDTHPDKNLYFTEQWTSPQGTFDGDLKWHVKNLIIGATRNWSKNVLEWNLAADPEFNPHTDDGGCTMCLGALTIDSSTVTRNVSYYIIAHDSKFVPDGSKRIDSNPIDNLPNVAFLTPTSNKILIVLNESEQLKNFNITCNTHTVQASLPASSVATYIFN